LAVLEAKVRAKKKKEPKKVDPNTLIGQEIEKVKKFAGKSFVAGWQDEILGIINELEPAIKQQWTGQLGYEMQLKAMKNQTMLLVFILRNKYQLMNTLARYIALGLSRRHDAKFAMPNWEELIDVVELIKSEELGSKGAALRDCFAETEDFSQVVDKLAEIFDDSQEPQVPTGKNEYYSVNDDDPRFPSQDELLERRIKAQAQEAEVENIRALLRESTLESFIEAVELMESIELDLKVFK